MSFKKLPRGLSASRTFKKLGAWEVNFLLNWKSKCESHGSTGAWAMPILGGP